MLGIKHSSSWLHSKQFIDFDVFQTSGAFILRVILHLHCEICNNMCYPQGIKVSIQVSGFGFPMVAPLPGTEPATWCAEVYLLQTAMAASSGSNLNNKFLQGWFQLGWTSVVLHCVGLTLPTLKPVSLSVWGRRWVCVPNRNHPPLADPKKSKHSPSQRSIRAVRLIHSAEHFLLQTLSCFLFYSTQATWSYRRMCNVFFSPSSRFRKWYIWGIFN